MPHKISRSNGKSASDEQPAHWFGPDRFGKITPDYIRIARALIGTTPAQLATQIGTRPGISVVDGACAPTKTPDGLAAALRVVIGWYEDRFATKARAKPAAPGDGSEDLEDLVRRYIVLRADWESREAVRLATAMREDGMWMAADCFAGGLSSSTAPAIARAGDRVCEPAVGPAATPWIVDDAPSAQAISLVVSINPRRRTALLVDDASDVLVVVGSFLESFGFDVVRASNADMALQFLAEGTPMDLLVSDHAMPGMSGRDLAAQALQLRPGLRALVITGFPDAAELRKLPPDVFLLAKPFRRAELSARVAILLGGGQAAGATPAMAGALRSV